MTDKKHGKCACGNIEYSHAGEPINIALCYCTDCQIHTGSDKFFALWALKDSLQITKGRLAVFTRLGDSGKPLHHHYCKDCGVTIYIDVTVANMISIAAMTLDNHKKLTPAIAIYTASAPEWAAFPKDIPLYEKLPPGLG